MNINCTVGEKDFVSRVAESLGMTVSSYCRRAIVAAAEQDWAKIERKRLRKLAVNGTAVAVSDVTLGSSVA